jgi:hypothetical protein
MEQVTTNRLLSFNEANTSRKTMMLMDEPTKRYMCPVTLFLSMAIADGVIKGIGCGSDISSLYGSRQQSG